MDRSLKALLTVRKWLGWVLAAVAALSSWRAWMLAYADGLKDWQAILVGWLALLLASAGLYYFLRLLDRVIDGIDRFREGRRVAKLLEESGAVEGRLITVQALAAIWMGSFPQNPYIYAVESNTKIRMIKAAVRQGLIRQAGEGAINAETFCDQASAAKFFRKRRWLEVKGELWREKDPPEKTNLLLNK